MKIAKECQIHYQQFTCYVELDITPRGNILTLKEHGTRETVVTITALPTEKDALSINEVAVKDYGDTEGILRQLVEQGVLAVPTRGLTEFDTGILICELEGDLKIA